MQNNDVATGTADNTVRSAVYYIAPGGNDNNLGTLDSPFATIQKAHDLVSPGDTIYLRGGTYRPPIDQMTRLSKSGTEGAPIRLVAYADEQPVIDGSEWTRRQTAAGGKALIWQTGDYWHVKGLEMINSSRSAYVAESVSNSIWEDLNLHDNDNSGLNIFGEGTENNLVLGGDFHHNFDPFRNGQDADGINIKGGSGKGNVVRGARLYANSDDGMDFFNFKDAITVENTWAYDNGYDLWNAGDAFEGDGSGFRLAGGEASELADLSHVIRNNLAWGNAARGFNYNSSQGAMQVYNNTSYDNGTVNYAFSKGMHELRNNVSVGEQPVQIEGNVDDANNSWTLDVTADSQDFLSVDDTEAKGTRQAGGALPETNFLKLAENSDLVDAGVDLGATFFGSAPDLGAFEQGATPEEEPVSPPAIDPPIEEPIELPISPPVELPLPPVEDPDPEPLPEPVPSSDLPERVARYGFDITYGDTIFDDSFAGIDNSGTLHGVTREEGDQRGRHVLFDGDDAIKIPNSRDINLGIHPERSVSLWFKVDDKSIDSRKQVLYEEGGGWRGLNAYVYDDSLYVGGWNNPPAGGRNQESGWDGTWLKTDGIASDQWHQLVFVLDGGKDVAANALTAYLDGEVFGSGEGSQLWGHSGGIGLGSVNRGTRFHDGASFSGPQGLAGAIDNVDIFNEALSAEQVQAYPEFV